jgi:Tol biopolymer transport system component
LEAGSFGFSWAPDSAQLAADGGGSPNGPDRHIIIADLNGVSRRIPEAGHIAQEFLEEAHEMIPLWSPDGAWIVWSTYADFIEGGLPGLQMYGWGLDGSVGPKNGVLTTPGAYAWSPDSTRIAAAYTTEGGLVVGEINTAEDFFLRLNPQTRGFTDGMGFSSITAIEWSPAGGLIAFSGSVHGAGDPDVWLSRLDGSPPVRLSTPGRVDSNPVFSPDGTMVAYISYAAGFADPGLFAVPVTGGVPRLVLPGVVEADW